MTKTRITSLALLTCALATFALGLEAQVATQSQTINLPRVSPRAMVGQRLGLTDVSVQYHRPSVRGRDVWGQVIPSAGTSVWRTGANENTLVTFSTPVSIEGQALAAGTYGLHSIPGKNPAADVWTIIFSHDIQAWGSFAYDKAHDALRVEVAPHEAANTEQLTFRFDHVGADTMEMVIAWEKVEVPVHIGIDREATVLADVRAQLTGLTAFFWPGLNQAAGYVLQNGIGDIDEAIDWADRSIQAEERFENLSTKAALLMKKGDRAAADEIMARATALGNAGQLHNYGRQLLAAGQAKQALAIFRTNAEKHPEAWFVGVGLARGLSAVGDFPNAAKSMRQALSKAPDNQKTHLQGLITQLEQGKDIN